MDLKELKTLSPRFLIRRTCQFNHEISFILFEMLCWPGCTLHRWSSVSPNNARTRGECWSELMVTETGAWWQPPQYEGWGITLSVWPESWPGLPSEPVSSPQCYSDFNRSKFLIKLMISVAESKHKTHPVLVIQIFNPSLGIPSCLRVGSSQAWN